MLLVIVAIPLFCLGVLLIDTSRQGITNSVLNGHREIVIRAAEEIELFLKSPEDILVTAAAMLGVTHSDVWKQETLLVELALNHPIFKRVSSIDLAGREIATSELGQELNWNYPRVAFQEAKRAKTYISELKFFDNHKPYIIMAVPIKELGKVEGVLVGCVNLRGVWDIVDNIKLGDTGRAFLVSHRGILIAHQDKKRVLKNENVGNQKDVQLAISGRVGVMELEGGPNKNWISSFAPISGKSWGLVLRQDQDEAYRFSKRMMTQSHLIILLSGLIALLVSIFMTEVLLKSIRALVVQTRRVAAGDLEHKIRIRRRDEIGELIRAFNDMTEKLKKSKARERLSVIGEATARIAHELKNSLVSIKTFVQLFPVRHKDEKFVDKFSRLVPQEINRLEHMFKELSDFSFHSELRITNTDVKKVIDSILEIMKDELLRKKINIKYNPQNDNFQMEADSERLKQVFMNLIINSINAMPVGGLLTVSIEQVNNESLSNPTHIEVRIKDTGKGMPKEVQEKLFEPFHTTKNGGMGLGLTISRKIVEQHGGEIAVESEIDRGTTFIVKLPRRRTLT